MQVFGLSIASYSLEADESVGSHDINSTYDTLMDKANLIPLYVFVMLPSGYTADMPIVVPPKEF